jgi:phospholipase C
VNKRDFIKMLGIAGTSAAAYAACSAYMREALAQSTLVDDLLDASAECKKGSLADIEHVVILMQENRSLDHYFGTLRGVRGFGDPRPLKFKNGDPVWLQEQRAYDKPSDKPAGEDLPKIKPFRVSSDETVNGGSLYLDDAAHDFWGCAGAWNGGLWDRWIPYKDIICMAHYTEKDLPLYFRLAKSFTLCDAYFCSVNGATHSNRSTFFTGTANGWNANDYYKLDMPEADKPNWTTYAEKLEKIGVSWKFYQETRSGDPATTPFTSMGCNTVRTFLNFQDENTPLFTKNKLQNTVLRTEESTPSQLEKDVVAGTLPTVSWIIPPTAFNEHPAYPPHFGEYYIHEILRALIANKEVWHKTVFFITRDENGGFFDHVIPPMPPLKPEMGATSPGIKLTPPDQPRDFNSEYPLKTELLVSIAKEAFIEKAEGRPRVPAKSGEAGANAEKAKTPTGMGMRVPMLVISPWSAGGRVCSEVFDHTSFIQFIETWLVARGIQKKDAEAFPNISSWRQTIAGDLTSVFDFSRTKTEQMDTVYNPAEAQPIFTEEKKAAAIIAAARPKKEPKSQRFVPTIDDVNKDPDARRPTLVKQDRTRCEILPVGYDFQVLGFVKSTDATNAEEQFYLTFRNASKLGAAFSVHAYDRTDGAWYYSLEPAPDPQNPVMLSGSWSLKDKLISGRTAGDYSYAVHGPNGYMAEFRGNAADPLQIQLPDIVDVKSLDDGKKLQVAFGKWRNANSKLKLISAYSGYEAVIENGTESVDITTMDGWYDVAFVDAVNPSLYLRRYAGHLENGKIGLSDPAIGLQYDEATRVYKAVTA